MSFANLYYKRATATAKPCFVCFKPTTTVLATINTVDFLYTCTTHLTDSGFATRAPSESAPATSAVSAEEIARVKAEWEEKQKLKQDREKEKEKAKEAEKEADKDKKDSEIKDKDQKKGSLKSPSMPGSLSASPSPSLPTHERYILHRDFFSMRQTEHRKRRQTSQAKELAPRLPGAPRGGLGL